MTELSIRLLGPLQVEIDGIPVTGFASDRARALLAYLATEADQPHRRDKLAGLLWPNSPQRTARTNLRRTLADLRKAIGDHQAIPPYLLITRQTIQFNSASNVWVDIITFITSQPADTSSHTLNEQTIRPLETAAELYRDHFLEGFYLDDSIAFEEWAMLKRERFQRQALLLLHRLVAHFEEGGAYEHAIPYAWRQVELDPFQEPAQRQVMRLLAFTGQRAAALSQYESLKNLLAEEMDMAPSARTTALYQKIKSGVLDLAVTTKPGVRGYELHEQIGAGHYGAVYRAVQPGVGREVAVKVIRSQFANRPDFIRRFEAEAQLVARLEHPYIVPLYDYWREPDGAYLVMRWLRGGSLQATLANGPLSLDSAVVLIEQISAALNAAHRQGIVHADIKPANILLDEDGNAYLSDFGIAKDGRQDLDQTITSDPADSPRAISPEQILSEPVTPLTDLYSLGLVLYELLTGSYPFADLSWSNTIDQCLHRAIPLAQAQRSDLPPAIDDVIQRATNRQPADRFPDAQALASAFRNATGAGGVSPVPILTPDAGTSQINPYKGLHAFQEADADLFYGRSAFVKQLLSRLAQTRFLAVVGPSGSGKSSVVKAGLIPALRQNAIPDSENWLIVEMTPGTQPLRELETALMPIAVNPPPSLLEPLQKDEQGLSRTLKRILPINYQGERSRLLLLIDQFEELFTLVEDKSARLHFMDSLLVAAQDPLIQLRIVATLRADFYDRPLQYPELGELLRQNTALALPLSPSELEQAICNPAAAAGVTVEPQLTATMMADVQEQPGALPLLQYALTELFEYRQGTSMTLAYYKEIGGVAGALSRRAEALYAALLESGQAAARQLFLRLITVSEGASEANESPDTRRRVLQSELAALHASDSFGEADVLKVIDEYGRYRLLTFDRDPNTRSPMVEVAHESLLHQWERLRNWLDESRTDMRQQRLLASAANEWLAAEQDEGFLLHDARLDQFLGWAENSSVALTHEEKNFLAASQSARQKHQAAEESRRRQELETARKLADTEYQRAEEQSRANRRLRWGAFVLALALIIAAILAVLATNAGRSANENALAAQSSAELATTREAEALTEAEQRAKAESEAIREREVAQAQERQAQARALAGAAVSNMQVDPELGVLLALQAVETTYSIDKSWVPEAVDALHHAIRAASRLQNIVHHSAGAMNYVHFSPDGSLLAASSLLDGQDVMTTVWDADTYEELFTLPTSIARFSTDSSQLITWRSSGLELIWEIWDIVDAEIEQTVSIYIEDLGFSAGGSISSDWQYFAVRYWDNNVKVWEMSSNENILHLTEHDDMVNSVLFSSDDTLLATAGEDGILKVWPMPANSAVETKETASILTLEHGAPLEEIAFSSDSKYLAAVSRDFAATIWDLQASSAAGSGITLITFPLTGHAETVSKIAYNDDGSLLAALSQDGLVTVWDTTKGEKLLTLVSNEHTRSIAFNPDGSQLVTANDAGMVQTWNITAAGEKEWLTLTGHEGAVNKANYSPDGTLLATVSSDETIKIWEADSGHLLNTIEGHTGDIRAVTFCPDGSCLTTASNDGTIKFWDLATGSEILTLDAYKGLPMNPIPENNVLDVAFTPDGRQLVSAGMDEEPETWDTATGEQTKLLQGHWYNVVSTAVSPDGQRIATTGPDGMMIIWDSLTGEQLFIQDTSEYGSWDVAFSPDNSRAATADSDGSVRIWDLNAQEGERLLLNLSGHGSTVRSVAFSPDGRTLASAASNQIRLWDANTGQSLYTLPGHARAVLDIKFSPDGSRLASAGVDGTARIYVLPIEELMALARSRLTRSLTEVECQTYLQLETCPAPASP